MKKMEWPSTYIFDALSDLGTATSIFGEDQQWVILLTRGICYGGNP